MDAWSTKSIDIEEVLSSTRNDGFHIFSNVVKSFDTIDRDTLDCALGKLGLPASHKEVRSRFELAAGLGGLETGLGHPQRLPTLYGFHDCALCSLVWA